MVLSRRGFIGSMGVLQARPRQLAQDFVAVFSSDDPATRVAYSPGIETLGNGRLIATMDLGLVVDGKKLEMKGGIPANRDNWLGRVFTSDDRGRSWTERGRFPARHARPFRCGKSVYILGHSDDLIVLRSDDGGIKWSEPVTLTKGDFWHAAPCNVWRSGGSVSFVMEKVTDPSFKDWSVSVLAPVVLSAKEGADLTRRESWVFSNELVFRDVEKARQVGVPFFKPGPQTPGKKDVRGNAPAGWLEFNTLQVMDPNDVWFDSSGRTLHLMGRSHTGTSGLACLAKAVRSEDGRSITVGLEKAPSGEPMLYVPCPAGQMKFHTLWDAGTRRYWLLGSVCEDSMTRPDRLPEERYNLPNNERHRLGLWFSKNLVDWQWAGMVAEGATPRQSRHYASMVIDGDDLLVLSRSGNEKARSAHDGNLITFHVVRGFRDLVW